MIESSDENTDYNKHLYYIFVEGKTDEYFIKKILLSSDEYNIIKYEGNTRLESRLKRFHKQNIPSFKDHGIKKILILADADNSATDSFGYIKSILSKLNSDNIENKYPVPNAANEVVQENDLKLGIFILPNNKDRGCLETLMLQSVKDTQLREVTDECAKKIGFYHGEKYDKVSFSQKENFRYLLYVDANRVLTKDRFDSAADQSFDLNTLSELKKFLSII